MPEGPVVSCQFAERLTAWLANLVAPLIAGRMSTDLRAVHTRVLDTNAVIAMALLSASSAPMP